jgi:hypothetical protein
MPFNSLHCRQLPAHYVRSTFENAFAEVVTTRMILSIGKWHPAVSTTKEETKLKQCAVSSHKQQMY